MILNHINHKMPIYKDCTLGEMLITGLVVFACMSISLSIITWSLFGYAWIGFTLSVLALVHVTKLMLGQLQKMKYGKPYGYYQQRILKTLEQQSFFKGLIKLPYLQRIGKWSVRRDSCV